MTYRAHDRQRFLRTLLDAIGKATLTGAVAVGCGGNVVVDANGTSGGEGGEGGGSTSTSTTTNTSTSTTTNTSTMTSTNPCGGVAPPGEIAQACVPMKGDWCPMNADPLLHAALGKVLGVCPYSDPGSCCGQTAVTEVLCALPPTGTQCCYIALITDNSICVGRPFTVAGEARKAPAVETRGGSEHAGWRAPLAADARAIAAMDSETRRAIAEGWARDAALEHASVAAFARLSLELLALGAPADLVREAQEAMGDEIRHAEISFTMASAYAGAKVAPGRLPIDGALGRTSLADLAAGTAREGCVGETIAAIVAAEARDAAIDPAAKAALASIAEDEARHAAGSWRLVAWAMKQGGDEVRAAVARAFEEAIAAGVSAEQDAAFADRARMRAHGRLAAAEIEAIASQALAEVIRPAAGALLM